jgi:hypothetical protein
MSRSEYNPYKGIPTDLIPARADGMSLTYIVIDVKEAIKVRHDFEAAVTAADRTKGILRLPGLVGRWESSFANSVRPGSKTMAGLAAEHQRLTLDAQSYSQLPGNIKLAGLLRENLRSLFPKIGFDESTGEPLRRLLIKGKSVLQIFDPIGVEDDANLIRLLLKPPTNGAFYW